MRRTTQLGGSWDALLLAVRARGDGYVLALCPSQQSCSVPVADFGPPGDIPKLGIPVARTANMRAPNPV
jgi:hypothetical protein